jgi:hypothetical protein
LSLLRRTELSADTDPRKFRGLLLGLQLTDDLPQRRRGLEAAADRSASACRALVSASTNGPWTAVTWTYFSIGQADDSAR